MSVEAPTQTLAVIAANHHALPVCISADDPLTFATDLADEYVYAWAGMLAGGVAPGEARAWLNDSAEASWRARFTLPATSRGP